MTEYERRIRFQWTKVIREKFIRLVRSRDDTFLWIERSSIHEMGPVSNVPWSKDVDIKSVRTMQDDSTYRANAGQPAAVPGVQEEFRSEEGHAVQEVSSGRTARAESGQEERRNFSTRLKNGVWSMSYRITERLMRLKIWP